MRCASMLGAGNVGTKRYFGPGIDLSKLAPAYATDGTMIAVAPFDAPAKHAATHAAGGSDPLAPMAPAAHASAHGSGGADPITTLGNVTIGRATLTQLRVPPITIPYAATITIDPTTGNDFSIEALTGNTQIGWTAFQPGHQGSLAVRQDATGGRTITFTTPGGYALRRDSAIADLSPASGGNAVTIYPYAFIAVGGISILLLSKILAV